MKSITYYQRQDYFWKEPPEEPKGANRYKTINLNPQNKTFDKYMELSAKSENLVTERLEKSYKVDSVFKEAFDHRRKKSFGKFSTVIYKI